MLVRKVIRDKIMDESVSSTDHFPLVRVRLISSLLRLFLLF